MKKDFNYKNIYLVTGILSIFVLFSVVSFIYLENKISKGSSVQIYEKNIKKR